MTRPPRPPRLARALASLVLRGEAREVIVGDLDEEFSDAIAAGVRRAVARRRYWRQTLASVVALWRDAFEERRLTLRPSRHPLRGLPLELKAVLRSLRRSPAYGIVAIVSLAIGIGANTTIFSVVRQLLLMPLPVEKPHDLRLIAWTPHFVGPLGVGNIAASSFADASGTMYRTNVTYPQYAAMRRAASGSADLAGYNFLRQMTASTEGRPPIVTSGMLASGNFFATVRPPLALGRGLTELDDTIGAAPVAVIGAGVWRQLFANDPNALGKTLRVNDVPVEIVGVTAASYRGLSQGGFLPPTDVTMALSQQPLISPAWSSPTRPLFTQPRTYWVRVIARLDASAESATREILQTTLGGMLVDGGIKPDIAAVSTVGIFPGARGADSVRTSAQQPLRILSIVAGIVLFIACINVAGLMLARGVSRQRELAIRRALGAGRARIIRELLLESVTLSALGGVAGLIAALWTAPVVQSMLTSGLGASGISVSLDWPTLGATAALACTAGVLAGLLPALRFSRNREAMLRHRTSSGTPRLMIGRALLALQIAVSLPLVVGAGLFLRTLHNFASIELGFEPRGLSLFIVDPTMNGQAREQTALVLPPLLERLEAIPGVTSATLLESALISGSTSETTVTIDGRDVDIFMNPVGPHYLETMGIRLIAGRPILATDTASQPAIVVINETAAKRFFGQASPIGARMKDASRDLTIVGVAADSKYGELKTDVVPTMLQAYLQQTTGSMNVAVRSTGPLGQVRAAIEAAVHDVAPTLPITRYRTQAEQIDETIGRERVIASLLTVFGGFALLLACVGLHGVTLYSVTRRTGEIGIRLALGAQRSQVLWLVMRQIVILAAVGLAIGLPIAWLSSPIIGTFLFGLDARDPLTIAGAAAVMVVVAVGAGLQPARRAAKLEALGALRTE